MPTFGENLRKIRQDRGISQKRIAGALGYQDRQHSQIWKYERGGLLPRPLTIYKIAQFLGCDPAELLEGVETDYDRLRAGTYRPPPELGGVDD